MWHRIAPSTYIIADGLNLIEINTEPQPLNKFPKVNNLMDRNIMVRRDGGMH